jgi:hypothetical protein
VPHRDRIPHRRRLGRIVSRPDTMGRLSAGKPACAGGGYRDRRAGDAAVAGPAGAARRLAGPRTVTGGDVAVMGGDGAGPALAGRYVSQSAAQRQLSHRLRAPAGRRAAAQLFGISGCALRYAVPCFSWLVYRSRLSGRGHVADQCHAAARCWACCCPLVGSCATGCAGLGHDCARHVAGDVVRSRFCAALSFFRLRRDSAGGDGAARRLPLCRCPRSALCRRTPDWAARIGAHPRGDDQCQAIGDRLGSGPGRSRDHCRHGGTRCQQTRAADPNRPGSPAGGADLCRLALLRRHSGRRRVDAAPSRRVELGDAARYICQPRRRDPGEADLFRCRRRCVAAASRYCCAGKDGRKRPAFSVFLR